MRYTLTDERHVLTASNYPSLTQRVDQLTVLCGSTPIAAYALSFTAVPSTPMGFICLPDAR